MCNANESRQGERAQHQWFPHQVSKHCAQPPNWNCNWRLPLSAATALHTATGSTKGNNELRANNAHKVDPNGNSCCCCAILIPWLPFDCASNNNKNKREPRLPLSRVATRSLSLSLTAVKLHTQSLRVSSNVRFGLARTLPVEK